MRAFCFIIVGLAGLIAAIAIMLYTVQFFLLFLIGGAIGKAIIMGILWIVEVFILNYFLFDYHGE